MSKSVSDDFQHEKYCVEICFAAHTDDHVKIKITINLCL